MILSLVSSVENNIYLYENPVTTLDFIHYHALKKNYFSIYFLQEKQN